MNPKKKERIELESLKSDQITRMFNAGQKENKNQNFTLWSL